MGGEVERAVIRVGGCLGYLSWQRGSHPLLWGGGWPAGSLGPDPLTSKSFMLAEHARPSPLMQDED